MTVDGPLSPGVEVVLAVDIGGTKLAAGLVDEKGEVVASARAPTPATTDGDVLLSVLLAVVDSVGGNGEVVGCGVGCGGPMTAGGEAVSPLHLPAWRDFPLRSRLAEATGLPTFVDNDAKALALGEGWCGAAAGVSDFLAVLVSTGIGGGIVLDGRLLDGAGGNAGHVGHVVVEPDGAVCRCGGRGCLEAEASGVAIAAATGAAAEHAPPEVVERTGRLVGRAVASVANLLDLRLAVVAGGVAAGFGEPFLAAARSELGLRARLEFSHGVELRPAALGADTHLVGAGAVAWRGLNPFSVALGAVPATSAIENPAGANPAGGGGGGTRGGS